MMESKIPKIIHQIWLGDQSQRPNDLIQTWIDKNPTWEHKLWTEKEVDNLTLRCKKQFDENVNYSGKADILRYELLYNFGGFFIDADSECVRPLEDFLCDNEAFAGYEHETIRPGLIANGYLASVANSDLLNLMIEHLSKIPNINITSQGHIAEPWLITGPTLLTEFVNKTQLPFTIYPSHYFIPIHYTNILDKTEGYTGDDYVFAQQYWGTTVGYDKLPKVIKNQSINEYFDNIYCINLDRRPDRWDEIKSEIDKNGLIVERVLGVDGNPNNIEKNPGVLEGDVGCTLSHYNIILDAKKRGLEKVLVLEDDAIFIDDLNVKFEEFIKQLPDDWDMVYFGGNHQIPLIPITENIFKVTKTWTTHAYAIRNTLFDVVIDLHGQGKKQVDVYYADIQPRFNCYVFKPHLAWQRDGFSDIRNAHMSYPFLK